MKRRRAELGLSQEMAATTANVSVETWARWERGSAMPHNRQRHAIARALQVPLAEVDRLLRSGGSQQA